MKKFLFLLFFFSVVLYAKNGCLKCHGGIEHIRSESSGMMKAILKKAEEAGERGNDCIVCHGGNPKTKYKKRAHSGTIKYFLSHEGPKEFYPAPGSPWINQNTCGMCHKEQVAAQMNSLMMTEQGKIHGTLYSFGGLEGYEHDMANFDAKNPSDPHSRLGTKVYQEYMQKLAKLNTQVHPKANRDRPKVPTEDEESSHREVAGYD